TNVIIVAMPLPEIPASICFVISFAETNVETLGEVIIFSAPYRSVLSRYS
ncbi:unnamed protein product, partial [marine sediment metagenome]